MKRTAVGKEENKEGQRKGHQTLRDVPDTIFTFFLKRYFQKSIQIWNHTV